MTAPRLGLRVGLVTSFGPDFPLDRLPSDLEIVNVPSDRTTIFSLEGSGRNRRLTLHSRAADLEPDHLPDDWCGAPLGMLCPVINEVDPALAASFAEGSLGAVPHPSMPHPHPRRLLPPPPSAPP